MSARPTPHPTPRPLPDRRSVLYGLGATLGTVALSSLFADEPAPIPAGRDSPAGPSAAGNLLGAKPGHVPSKATRCIFVMLEGGPSHIDTFDPKPKLDDLHMQEFVREEKFASAMSSGKRYFVKSPWGFRPAGKSGLPMATVFEHLPTVADELCVFHGLQAESVNHPTACYHINTGNRFGGDPAFGSWTLYGLGTENANLPGFIVLPETNFPQGGAANWGAGFLPADYQGTPLRAVATPILDLAPPPGVTPEIQRANLDLLAALDAEHAAGHPASAQLSARLASYELAFRMQAEVPDLLDLQGESEATRARYGVGDPRCHDAARRFLLARRLIERGVRFVQAYVAGWDSHDYLERSHGNRIAAIDRPLAALIGDLKDRGLLDSTLVVVCGEFGRSPDNGIRGGGARVGRDHNQSAMVALLAGGGVPGGTRIGATDELGQSAVECVHPIRDFHVTLLRLLGLDDNKLTYFHAGRFKQLSQIGGRVIPELLG